MTKEQWKDVKGFEDCYSISNFGRLKSKDRLSKPYKNGQRHTVVGILRKPSIKNGYYFCWLQNQDGTKYMQYIHRLVSEAFVPNKKNLPIVDHIDGNRLNNHHTNLRWCTSSKNSLNSKKHVGYYYHTANKRYYPRVKHRGKVKSFGGYKSIEEAGAVYKAYKHDLMEKID